MTRIIACISTYGSSKTLEETLHSIKPYVDHLVVVYGHYLGFPPLINEQAEGESSTKTGNVIRDSGIPASFSVVNNLLQKDKRSIYLTLNSPNWYNIHHSDNFTFMDGDWLLIIDDDEIFESKYNKDWLISELPLDRLGFYKTYGTVLIKNIWQGIDILQNRFVKWAPNLKYYPNHWTISKGEEVYVQTSSPPFHEVLGAQIANNPATRSKNWQHHRALYRLLRFVFNQKDWKDGYFEAGEHKPEFYDPELVQKVIDKVTDKVAKEQNQFDIAFLETLAWIASNCERDTIWSDGARGRVAALLYAYNLVPDPYV